jgi:endonuclease V-like protein UPF0215 family
MRSDLVIDGFGIGTLKVSGSDATEAVLSLFRQLKRNDINVVLLSGSVLSLYNILDVDLLYEEIRIPILALTFKKSKADLARNIKAKFKPGEAKDKIRLLEKLGTPKRMRLETGYQVFARAAGASSEQVESILNKFTLQGAIPEPIRVARLIAKAVSAKVKVVSPIQNEL